MASAENLRCHICDVTVENDVSMVEHMVMMHSKDTPGETPGSGSDRTVEIENKGKPSQDAAAMSEEQAEDDKEIQGEIAPSPEQPCDVTEIRGRFKSQPPTNGRQSGSGTAQVAEKELSTGEQSSRSKISHSINSPSTNRRKSHLIEHTAQKPHKCTQCGSTFSRKGYLTQHIRTHTGNKPFKCDLCGKAFVRKSDLARHFRTHSGEKPRKCNECGKSFVGKSNLTKHVRTHSGEKPYKCSQCGKAFVPKAHLTRHSQSHSGENGVMG